MNTTLYSKNQIGKERTKLILMRIENTILNVVNCLYNSNKLKINLNKLPNWELYYSDTVLFQHVYIVRKALIDICWLLGTKSWELGITLTSHGLVAGNLIIYMCNGNILDCSKTTEGIQIPQDVLEIDNFKSNAKYILIIEKNSTFQKIINEGLLKKNEYLMITGKGFPDIITRLFVKQLSSKLNIPILALVDGNPFGMEIMCVYRFGSCTMVHQNEMLSVPSIKWLGVHPTDIESLNLPSISLTSMDQTRVQSLLKRTYINSNHNLLHQTIKMDACIAVDREVDKVLSKFGDIRQTYSVVLQQLIDNLETVKNDLQSNTNDERKISLFAQLKTLIDKSKQETQKLAIEHRELHSTVSKVGKAIDKNFISDFAATCKEDIFAEPKNTVLLNNIICQHFYRLGMLEIADEVSKESGIIIEPSMREPFAKLNYIKESLQNRDIGPALEWAKENRSQLEAQMYPPYPLLKRISVASHLPVRIPYHAKRAKFGSCIMKPRPKTKKIKRLELAKKILHQFYKSSALEFKLHQLEFLSIIQKGVEFQTKAVEYARANFGQFVDKYQKEIQAMMGMLLYLPQGLEKSPYADMVQSNMWEEVNELFTRDACSLLGLSYDSLLNVSINAGCVALPALLSIKHVMKQRNVDDIWSGKDELPIEIDLEAEHRYHSMFACPILRQQSSDTNPPMRLICGHIISKDALSKLGTPNKLKCPYCPMEQSSSEAKHINF